MTPLLVNCISRSVKLVKQLSLDWAAGFFEGEGSAVLHTDKRNKKTYRSLHLSISQVYREPLDCFRGAVGAGTVNGPYGPYSGNRQPYYQWSITGKEAIVIAKLLIPLMFQKGEQTRYALDAYEDYLKYGE